MNKTITFVTSNKRKIHQATTVLKEFGYHVEPLSIDIDEVQSHDPLHITLKKAQCAYEVVKKPLVVCDHSWSVPSLNGFPGGYMKEVNSWLTADDWIALMKNKTDRAIVLTETIVYTDGDNEQVFSVEFPAQITEEPRGIGYVPGERVVVYDGSSKTIAEHIDAGEHARDMSKSAWTLLGEWLSIDKDDK